MDELLARPPAPRSPIERARDWLEWFGVGRLLAVAVSVGLVGAGGYWLVAPPPAPVEASLPMTAGAATTTVAGSAAPGSTGEPAAPSGGESSTGAATESSTSSTEAVDIVVHVAGAVLVPGVHRLPAAARVADAIAAAGGAAPDADTDAINLAAPLHDGDRVFVPRVSDDVDVTPGVTPASPGVSGPAGAVAADVPVSINTATVDQLDALPGVGPATAAAIVAHRDQYGPFTSIDGLADVRGIGPAKLEAIRPLVTL